ncbi:MAG: hypothetical protein HYZ75_15100 [Elusimicrobia bacterium]|nr:hypothetical protein [Elusimicrobiota bacterium]
MSELLQRSERLVILWSEIDAMVASFQRSDYASLSPAEKRYFNVLSGYVAALIRTVNALVDRQRLLNSKSEGTEVSWVEYKQKEEIYDDCVRQYKAIGHELNASSKIVFSQ